MKRQAGARARQTHQKVEWLALRAIAPRRARAARGQRKAAPQGEKRRFGEFRLDADRELLYLAYVIQFNDGPEMK